MGIVWLEALAIRKRMNLGNVAFLESLPTLFQSWLTIQKQQSAYSSSGFPQARPKR